MALGRGTAAAAAAAALVAAARLAAAAAARGRGRASEVGATRAARAAGPRPSVRFRPAAAQGSPATQAAGASAGAETRRASLDVHFGAGGAAPGRGGGPGTRARRLRPEFPRLGRGRGGRGVVGSETGGPADLGGPTPASPVPASKRSPFSAPTPLTSVATPKAGVWAPWERPTPPGRRQNQAEGRARAPPSHVKVRQENKKSTEERLRGLGPNLGPARRVPTLKGGPRLLVSRCDSKVGHPETSGRARILLSFGTGPDPYMGS